MPSDDGDFEPALDSTTTAESSTESEPVVKRAAVEAAAVPTEKKIGAPPDDAVDDPGLGPRSPRVRSDKNRAMFQALVKQVQAGEVDTGGDLEPMHTTASPPAAAVPAVAVPPPTVTPAAPSPPPAAAAAAPLAPVAIPPGLPPLPLVPLPATPAPPPDPRHAEREAAIAAREAALVERERLLPDRTALAERPGETLMAWVRSTYDIAADDHEGMKTALKDLVTDLSERGLDVKLPDEVKAAMESRKALRGVKAYKRGLDDRERLLNEQRAAQDKAAAEARELAEQKQRDAAYVNRIGELIAPAKEQHRFLHDPEVTGGLSASTIVYEVVKEQQRIAESWQKEHPGYQLPAELAPDLAKATEYANSYYKTQAEELARKAAHLQSLLAPATPAPAAAPAKAATSPGGAPGPAPTTPTTPAPVEWDPSDLPMDRQQRRQASLARLVAARKAAPQQA
jgi:hypothetical protein